MNYRVTVGAEIKEFDSRGEAMKYQRQQRNEGRKAVLWYRTKGKGSQVPVWIEIR